ncbi:MAG: hypothetical protein CM1200mP36_03660 [Gammaproteobacteria bacterium]|nr:MAG: hypothetical protein CM1200mP36_03660 [Gammaproteobacteria bacterium]
MHGMVNIAVRAARQAGSIIVRHLNQLETLEVVEKGRNEFVSQVDRLAEEAIIEVIREYHPDHSILAEESGERGNHEYQWIIDPLDGTRIIYTDFRFSAFPSPSLMRDRSSMVSCTTRCDRRYSLPVGDRGLSWTAEGFV